MHPSADMYQLSSYTTTTCYTTQMVSSTRGRPTTQMYVPMFVSARVNTLTVSSSETLRAEGRGEAAGLIPASVNSEHESETTVRAAENTHTCPGSWERVGSAAYRQLLKDSGLPAGGRRVVRIPDVCEWMNQCSQLRTIRTLTVRLPWVVPAAAEERTGSAGDRDCETKG